MAAFALWTRSMRGPAFSVIRSDDDDLVLTEFQMRAKLCDPIPIRQEHLGSPLNVLAYVYPLPDAAQIVR